MIILDIKKKPSILTTLAVFSVGGAISGALVALLYILVRFLFICLEFQIPWEEVPNELARAFFFEEAWANIFKGYMLGVFGGWFTVIFSSYWKRAESPLGAAFVWALLFGSLIILAFFWGNVEPSRFAQEILPGVIATGAGFGVFLGSSVKLLFWLIDCASAYQAGRS